MSCKQCYTCLSNSEISVRLLTSVSSGAMAELSGVGDSDVEKRSTLFLPDVDSSSKMSLSHRQSPEEVISIPLWMLSLLLPRVEVLSWA